MSDATDRRDALDQGPEHPEEVWAKKEFGLLMHRLEQLPDRSRARMQSLFMQKLLSETLRVDTPAGPLSFVLLGRASGGRAVNLLTKQPGTIRWIDQFEPNATFWDVGANVGAYTLYAALRGQARVIAIEPAAVNYFLLSANCEANHVDDRVDCLLLGLGRERAIARLEVSQFDPARSFSFLAKRDQPQAGRQAALVMSMDELTREYGVPAPNYLKIDTPGMTEAIVEGGLQTLQRPEVREVHIEMRAESKAGQRIARMFEQCGFVEAARDEHGGSADITFARR